LGALVYCEQTVRERVARQGRRMRRVYAGTLVHCTNSQKHGGQAKEEDAASVYG